MSTHPARRNVSIRSSKVDSTERKQLHKGFNIVTSVSQVGLDGFQQCTKCRQIKELDQFFRRGVGRHRICRICWKGYAVSKTKRIKWINPQPLYPIMLERINNLESKLRFMAFSFAFGRSMEADDIYSAMVDEILFKSKPTDSDAMILTRAKWAGCAVLRSNALYNSIVGDESEMTVTDEDGEADIEIRVSASNSAEKEYIERERTEKIAELISKLEPQYQKIVAMISLGYKQTEIAYRLKVSDSTVANALKKIGAKLEELGFKEI